jgi:SAM-dependent methyltransferase
MAMDAQVIDFNYQFDVIIFCEVLEHTKTPLEVVKNIETHLKPDGILILTIPNGYCMSEMIIGQILCGRGKSSLFYRMVRPLYGFITGTKTSQIYPFCVDSLHIQFFSLSKVGKLFKNFTIESLEHTDLGLFFVGAGRFSKLKEVECQIADHLPHNLVGGWMMVLKKR